VNTVASAKSGSAGRHGGRALAISRADLRRLQRDSVSHLLLVGGRAGDRRALAMSFHRASALRRGHFVSLHCETQDEVLRDTLEQFLSGMGVAPNPLWAARHGMLFLESVGSLSGLSQRLLLAFIHASSVPDAFRTDGWSGRLAAGTDEDLWDLVARGSFERDLADGLDKIRVDLDPRKKGGAA
jgi:DNA-binding NtrC family response regulator